MKRSLVGLLVLLVPSASLAQIQPLAKRIVLAGENAQVHNRLEALARQTALLASPRDVARFIGASAMSFPLGALAALMLDNSSLEKWEQVLDDYQKIIEEAGDALVPLTATMPAPPSIQARRLAHLRIAALPPSILKMYRQRIDPQAEKLLQEGRHQRIAASLRRLVDDSFCSSFADQALDLLGDLAFEQGDFEESLAWWRMLIPPSGAASLHFPDPKVDIVRVRAKEVLASAFLGRMEQARLELAAFAKLHPSAKGALAGGDGLYITILETWIKRLVADGAADNQEPWTTFAGTPARNRALAVCPPTRLWLDGPTWRVRLADRKQRDAADPVSKASLAFHPLVVNDQVLVADANSVMSYQLFTGKQLFRFVLKDSANKNDKTGEQRAPGVSGAQYTLTAWNDHGFARMGGQTIGPKAAEDKADAHSTLVCLRLTEPPTSPPTPRPSRLAWQIPATTPDNMPAFFEGAPLAADGRVFSAVSWVLDKHTHTAVACYDATTGKRRWCQAVCTTPEFEDHAEPRKCRHLLTLAGGRIYYCSHSGAVVALDPWSGQRLWGARYLSRGPKTDEGAPSPRDLAPCVYADGRLFVAPLDADRLLCLDATNGRLVWEQEGIEVVHLLGVAHGKVYFTTTRGLQCLRADTGTTQGGWVQPAEGRLPGLGRGLLAGSWLLWPTRDPQLPLRGVTLDEGNQERFVPSDLKEREYPDEPEYLEPTMLRGILPGNMAFGQGCLVVAGAKELVAYVPQKHFLKERQEKMRDAKKTPLALYQLALAQADAGLMAEAVSNWQRLRAELPPGAGANHAWDRLCSQRIAEARGDFKSPQRIICSRPAHYDASLVDGTNPSKSLKLPLHKAVELPSDRFQALARPSATYENLVLGQHGQSLFCLNSITNKISWTESIPLSMCASEPTLWRGTFANLALRADPERLAAISLTEGGKPLWIQPIPLRPTAPFALRNGQPREFDNPFPPVHFQCNNRFLFFMIDQRLLLALDPAQGKFAWAYWAPGGKLRPLADGGRFSPHYHAGDRFVMLQTTAGKWLVLDSHSGKLLHEGPASRPWTHSPLPLDDRHFVLSAEAGQLLLLDAATGSTVWTYQPPGYTSLTGSPTQVFGEHKNLLALVSRNIGTELVRLDAAKGTALWTNPALPAHFEAGTAAVDDNAVFFACQDTLQARSLRDGTLLWKKKLPGSHGLQPPTNGAYGGWQTVRAGAALLVYPREESPLPSLFPRAFSWPIVFQTVTERQQERAILVLDPHDGQWLQRLPLTDSPGPISVQIGTNRLVVSAGGTLSVFRP